jgi:hypothetical protein
MAYLENTTTAKLPARPGHAIPKARSSLTGYLQVPSNKPLSETVSGASSAASCTRRILETQGGRAVASEDSAEAFVKSVETWITAKRAWSEKANDPDMDRETFAREAEKLDALFADMKAKFFGIGATRPIQGRTN